MISRNFTPEQVLVDKLPFDDTDAFKELSRRYCFPLYTYCQKKLNSDEDSKLIVRNIFISLWEERRTLPVDFSLPLYLSLQVRRRVSQYLRARMAGKSNRRPDVAVVERQRPIGKPVIDSYVTNAMAGLLA